VARLEEKLAKAQEEIRKVAIVIPLPQTPTRLIPAQPTSCLSILPLFPKAMAEPAMAGIAIPGL